MPPNNDRNPGTSLPEHNNIPPSHLPESRSPPSSSSPSSTSTKTMTLAETARALAISPASPDFPAPVGTPKCIYPLIMSRPPLSSTNYTPEAALHRPVEYFSDTEKYDPGKNKDYALDKLTRKSLPYFVPWSLSAGPKEVAPDFTWLQNSCGGRAAVGVFGGGVMGLLMGVFMGALSDNQSTVQVAGGKDVPQAPLKEQVRYTMRTTAEKSMYWCRNFAFITGVFGGSECLVEKFRGKHDMWNPVVSGCITGAALQAHAGPQAAAIGCGGFAAFSIVIDKFMGTYD